MSKILAGLTGHDVYNAPELMLTYKRQATRSFNASIFVYCQMYYA